MTAFAIAAEHSGLNVSHNRQFFVTRSQPMHPSKLLGPYRNVLTCLVTLCAICLLDRFTCSQRRVPRMPDKCCQMSRKCMLERCLSVIACKGSLNATLLNLNIKSIIVVLVPQSVPKALQSSCIKQHGHQCNLPKQSSKKIWLTLVYRCASPHASAKLTV